jgi:hypothetical protein
MFSRCAGKLVRVVGQTLLAAAGQFIAELCAASQRLDDKRQIAVLKRQLETTSASAGRWHLRAMDLEAMLSIRDGETVVLPNLQPGDVQTVHAKQRAN